MTIYDTKLTDTFMKQLISLSSAVTVVKTIYCVRRRKISIIVNVQE